MRGPTHLGGMMDTDQTARLIYLSILLAALAGWIAVEDRQRMGQALGNRVGACKIASRGGQNYTLDLNEITA